MESKDWVVGYQVAIPLKFAYFLLITVGCGVFFVVGIKLDILGCVLVSVVMTFILLGGAFYKTWFYVDENKNIHIKKRFYIAREKVLDTKNSVLSRVLMGVPISSGLWSYNDQGPISSIYLHNKVTNKSVLVFSSDKNEDIRRVRKYLSLHFGKF